MAKTLVKFSRSELYNLRPWAVKTVKLESWINMKQLRISSLPTDSVEVDNIPVITPRLNMRIKDIVIPDRSHRYDQRPGPSSPRNTEARCFRPCTRPTKVSTQ